MPTFLYASCVSPKKTKRLHVLKGDLAEGIKELAGLYEAASAREAAVAQQAEEAARSLRADVAQRSKVMAEAADEALTLRLHDEAAARGWLLRDNSNSSGNF